MSSPSRYIRNARLKRELGVTLLYPTYREGLAAQLKEESRLAGGGLSHLTPHIVHSFSTHVRLL